MVDDHGDLAEAAVRGRLERLPELALLELAVAGEHVDPTRAARAARSASTNPRAFEMPMPSEPVLVTTSGVARRPGGRAGRRGGAAGGSARSRAARARSAPRRGRARRGPSRRSSGRRRRSTSRWSQETMSMQLKVVPRWPEPARSIMYSAFRRQASAKAAARSYRVGVEPGNAVAVGERARSAARSSPPRPLHLCPPVPLLEGGAHELRLLQRALDACLQRLRA